MPENSPRWVKSTHSMQNGDCTEIRPHPLGLDGTTEVRDGKDPARGHLTIARASWTAFTTALRTPS